VKLLLPLVVLAFVALLVLFCCALTWYVLLPLIPPEEGPWHVVVVLLVVTAGIGMGVLRIWFPGYRRTQGHEAQSEQDLP
jgi:hypothetical protein